MKKVLLKGALALTMLATVLASCQKDDIASHDGISNLNTPVDMLMLKSGGITTFDTTVITPVFDSTADLTADEIEFIYAVREDEKIARDLYSSFFEKYQLKPFEQIFRAESNHIQAIEILLRYYEIEYPALGEIGQFEDSTRQVLYDSLLVRGSSELEAFRVMAQMEESNIVYYREALDSITNQNIKIVLENLEKASENHFKASIRQITALGGTYTPVMMTESDYRAIIAIGFEKGHRYMYKNNGLISNSGKYKGKSTEARGRVNEKGECEYSSNRSLHGSQSGESAPGKDYRGGNKR